MKAGTDIHPLAPGIEIILTCLRIGLQGHPMTIHAGPRGLVVKMDDVKIAHGRNLRELRDSWNAWLARNA